MNPISIITRFISEEYTAEERILTLRESNFHPINWDILIESYVKHRISPSLPELYLFLEYSTLSWETIQLIQELSPRNLYDGNTIGYLPIVRTRIREHKRTKTVFITLAAFLVGAILAFIITL